MRASGRLPVAEAGRVAVVTGAARGIGLALTRKFLDAGYRVAMLDVDAANLAPSAKEVGRGVLPIACDVSVPAQVKSAVARIEADFGRIDALVNNAGVGNTQGPFEDTRPEDLVYTFEVNVFGLFYCSQAAVRRMSTRHGGKGGAIVNLSSAAARTGGVGAFIDYAGSKAAVDVITTGLAREVGGVGIRVNAVRPGVTETDMIAHARAMDPTWLDTVVKTMPMGRIGQVREISHAVVWLLSDEASYVTGTIIDASGGRAVP